MAAQLVRRLLILGAPGSGKGTLANRIVKTYGMPYVVVGDLLRRNVQERSGTIQWRCLRFDIHSIRFIFQEDSKTITDHLNKGILLPDDLVLKLLIEELEKVREQGFLLEGNSMEQDHSSRVKPLYSVSLVHQVILGHWIKPNCSIDKRRSIKCWHWTFRTMKFSIDWNIDGFIWQVDVSTIYNGVLPKFPWVNSTASEITFCRSFFRVMTMWQVNPCLSVKMIDRLWFAID